MFTPKRSTGLISLAAVIILCTIGTIGSGWSLMSGWGGFILLPVYFAGFLVVLVTSIVILARDTCLFAKPVLFPILVMFVISSFLVTGDNGDQSGYHYLGKSYYGQHPTGTFEIASGIAFVLFMLCGFTALVFMIVSASSRKRTLVDR